MNDIHSNHDPDEPADMVQRISDAVEHIQPNPHFAAELEKKLRMKHPSNTGPKFPAFKQLAPTLGWIALVAAFGFVLDWSIRNLIPREQPGALATPTLVLRGNNAPVTEADGIPFRGGRMFLTQPLPVLPEQADIYRLMREDPITAEEARLLAEQFGIIGEVYNAQDLLYKYTVTDGKQSMSIGSKYRFFYTSDLVKYARNSAGASNENAEVIIRDFLQSHGINIPFSISNRELYGGYVMQQIAPDGLPMQYEYFSTPVMRVTLDENGEVYALEANWMEFDQAPIATYEIIRAEEALGRVLDDNIQGGKIESVHSGGGEPPQQWFREYKDEETVSIYGSLMVAPAVEPAKPPLITLDGTMLLGNTAGLEALEGYSFIKATGRYTTENGIRRFTVDAWDADSVPDYLSGSLRREGDQIMLVSDDGTSEYTLVDPPADLPLNTTFPESQLSISGVIAGETLDWINITFYSDASQMGGGGGGGGLGFHQLNLSGTPIPFPTPTPAPSILEAPALSKLDGMRGMLSINLYSNTDGNTRTEYGFISSDPGAPYLVLQGENLVDLLKYNNKPVEIWGTMEGTSDFGAPLVKVERYTIPFPELKSQILKGTEQEVELEGKPAVLFTAQDGAVYVEFMPGCNELIPVESMSGLKGSNAADGDSSIQMEALAVPDLSFAGHPGVCVFITAPATQQNGDPFEMTITSDQPNQLSDPPALSAVRANLTIDNVELIYFVSNPNTPGSNLGAALGDLYLQPAWHFHGHYETGDEYDVIVQALKQEFLSPELTPYQQGG